MTWLCVFRERCTQVVQAALCRPYMLNGSEASISVSIGICPFGAGIANADAMLAQVDLALYRSKEEGRNQYHFHSEDLDQEVLERVTLGGELLLAIERDELELQYQPQVELSSEKIIGIEALVRWNHPTRGLVSPLSLFRLQRRPAGSYRWGTGCSIKRADK